MLFLVLLAIILVDFAAILLTHLLVTLLRTVTKQLHQHATKSCTRLLNLQLKGQFNTGTL